MVGSISTNGKCAFSEQNIDGGPISEEDQSSSIIASRAILAFGSLPGPQIVPDSPEPCPLQNNDPLLFEEQSSVPWNLQEEELSPFWRPNPYGLVQGDCNASLFNGHLGTSAACSCSIIPYWLRLIASHETWRLVWLYFDKCISTTFSRRPVKGSGNTGDLDLQRGNRFLQDRSGHKIGVCLRHPTDWRDATQTCISVLGLIISVLVWQFGAYVRANIPYCILISLTSPIY